MSRSSMGPLVSAHRPARVRAGEPSRRDTYRRERPPQRRRGVCHAGCHTACHTPPEPCRASGQKGGVAPVLSLTAGAVRVRRSTPNSPNNDGETWTGGVPHPPFCLCHTSPSVGVACSRTPARTPARTPRTVQTTGQHRAPHVAASGLMSRIVLHVEKRSIAPRAVALTGVPSGSWLKYRYRSDACSQPPASRRN